MIFPIAKNKMASLFAVVGLWENRKMNYIFDLNFSFLHQIFWFIRIGENFVRNSMRNFSCYLWHFQLQKKRFFFHKIIFQNFLSLKAEIIIKQKKKKIRLDGCLRSNLPFCHWFHTHEIYSKLRLNDSESTNKLTCSKPAKSVI